MVSERLLITGSRDATPAMLDYAARVVERAKERGWSIVVGDAAGIDSAVVDACWQLAVPFTCYGITARPRLTTCKVGTLIASPEYVQIDATSYLTRDEVMCRRADRCIAIWNGRSRGTKYTFDYAFKLYPSNCNLVTFER